MNGHRRKSKSLEERFWERVNKDGPIPPHCPELGPCWLWTGSKFDRKRPGMPVYGRLYTGTSAQTGFSRYEYAHRVSWLLHAGEIPDGLSVCHHCDNGLCVRPGHHFIGTQADNNADRDAKGRNGRVGRFKNEDRWPVRAYRQTRSDGSGRFTSHHFMLMEHLRDQGVPQTIIAARFGIDHMYLNRVLNRHIDRTVAL